MYITHVYTLQYNKAMKTYLKEHLEKHERFQKLRLIHIKFADTQLKKS